MKKNGSNGGDFLIVMFCIAATLVVWLMHRSTISPPKDGIIIAAAGYGEGNAVVFYWCRDKNDIYSFYLCKPGGEESMLYSSPEGYALVDAYGHLNLSSLKPVTYLVFERNHNYLTCEYSLNRSRFRRGECGDLDVKVPLEYKLVALADSGTTMTYFVEFEGGYYRWLPGGNSIVKIGIPPNTRLVAAYQGDDGGDPVLICRFANEKTGLCP